MNTQIINTPKTITIYGFGGISPAGQYAATAFKLMDKMWQVIKAEGLKNAGLNTWVYEDGHRVFAGVELNETPAQTNLETKSITLCKYAYYKHIGPYNQIGQSGKNMTAEIHNLGFETVLPYIEIYGHWTSDESKLETELLMQLV